MNPLDKSWLFLKNLPIQQPMPERSQAYGPIPQPTQPQPTQPQPTQPQPTQPQPTQPQPQPPQAGNLTEGSIRDYLSKLSPEQLKQVMSQFQAAGAPGL